MVDLSIDILITRGCQAYHHHTINHKNHHSQHFSRGFPVGFPRLWDANQASASGWPFAPWAPADPWPSCRWERRRGNHRWARWKWRAAPRWSGQNNSKALIWQKLVEISANIWCVYIYIYIHTYRYTYIYIEIHLLEYVCVYIYTHRCIYMYENIYKMSMNILQLCPWNIWEIYEISMKCLLNI